MSIPGLAQIADFCGLRFRAANISGSSACRTPIPLGNSQSVEDNALRQPREPWWSREDESLRNPSVATWDNPRFAPG